MAELAVPESDSRLKLDVCVGCQIIWFDSHEYEQFPHAVPESPKNLPEKAREIIALNELRRYNERVAREGFQQDGPDEWWHMIPALLGLPVEEDAPPLKRLPWLTYALGASLVFVFASTAWNLETAVNDFGLIPSQMWRHGGITFLTSFFLHGSLLHLLGNVYFLLIFGDNVEDDLGPWGFVTLLAIAALVGDGCHILGNLHSSIPSIGASGGISGVITYYALRFPRARLGFLFRYYGYLKWLHFPAMATLAFWFLLQFLYVYLQQQGVSNIAALAHLGGAVAGVAAWLLRRPAGLGQQETA